MLRRFTAADADNLYALDGDPEVMRFLDDGRPKSRGSVEAEVLPRVLRVDQHSGRFGYWAAVERATGGFVGWFVLHPAETGDAIELGYRLRRSAWGRGYATEGSRALIRQAFARPDVRRVFAETMAVNVASRRVMEKVGLRHVRTFHVEWPDPIEGSEHGEVEYEITRPDWERRTRGQEAKATPVDAKESWDLVFSRSDDWDKGEAWLERWWHLLEKGRPAPVLDLGCGTGRDASFLARRGFDVVAADFSEKALEVTQRRVPQAETKNVDLALPLPFPDAGFGAVVASLSLHYFPWRQTETIIKEVRRCLVPGGPFLVRLNSARDARYAVAGKKEIEPGFYLVDGHPKRLFDHESVLALFATGWVLLEAAERTTQYGGSPKTLWEVVAKKAGS